MLSESSVLAIAEFAGCIPAARLASASKAFSVAKRFGNEEAYIIELETILNSRPLQGSLFVVEVATNEAGNFTKTRYVRRQGRNGCVLVIGHNLEVEQVTGVGGTELAVVRICEGAR